MVLRGLRAAADVILPRECVVCGRKLLSDESELCLKCLSDMPQTHFWEMSHNPMADKFNAIIQKNIGTEREAYVYASALFFYHSNAGFRKIPYQIKYEGNIPAGRYFGNLAGSRMASSALFDDVDLIVPVPLHWTRRWKRGYNQAEIIAAGVAEEMGATMRSDLLIRTRRTVSQTMMEVEDKMKNVSGAFAVSKSCSDMVCRHILIVDDVFTTGSTLHACFVALRAVFPPSVRISVATLAYVGRA